MKFAGMTAVITGGGQGIGAAIARALADGGASIVVAARNLDRVKTVAESIEQSGGKARAVRCDVTDPSSVHALASAASRQGAAVDILINNAGVAHSAPLHKITLDDWQRVFAVNATGTFLCTQAFVAGMLERKRGSVVNIASIAGLEGGRYIAAYAAAKHAVIGFTRSVAAELEGTGVTCNAVCPGYVDTPMTEESVARVVSKTGKSAEEALSAMLAASDQQRLVTPEEVAQAVLKLCDPKGKRPNGMTVKLTG